MSGQVAYWDIRKSSANVAISNVRDSHRDPVRSLHWIHSKTSTEFYTGSSDGQVRARGFRNARIGGGTRARNRSSKPTLYESPKNNVTIRCVKRDKNCQEMNRTRTDVITSFLGRESKRSDTDNEFLRSFSPGPEPTLS